MANEYLSEDELDGIAEDVRIAVEGLGSDGSRSITYTRPGARTTTATTDTIAEAAPVSATFLANLTTKHSQRDKDKQAEKGPRVYLIEARRLLDAPPDGVGIVEPIRRDRIFDSKNGKTYEVKEWGHDPLEKLYSIMCIEAGT